MRRQALQEVAYLVDVIVKMLLTDEQNIFVSGQACAGRLLPACRAAIALFGFGGEVSFRAGLNGKHVVAADHINVAVELDPQRGFLGCCVVGA